MFCHSVNGVSWGTGFFFYTAWKALVWAGLIITAVTGFGVRGRHGSGCKRCSGILGIFWWHSGGDCGKAWQFSLRAATAGTKACWHLGPKLCTMDWVEEVPEWELPERDEERELGFTSLALGASASSLKWEHSCMIYWQDETEIDHESLALVKKKVYF